MIYLDSSVALAFLFAERRVPPTAMWYAPLVSSRLLEFEMWNRVHACGRSLSHGDAVRSLIERILLIELERLALVRALEPMPLAVGTLDGLHLATIEYLRSQRRQVELASYDERMLAAARAMQIPIFEI